MSTNSTQAHQVSHKLLVGTVSGKRRGLGKAKKASNLFAASGVVRRVCSELIMWYMKLIILDFETPLAATRLPTRRLATSLSRTSNFPLAPRDFPFARLATRVGLSNRGSKSEWAHGGRGSLTPLGPEPLGRAK
jgi:hypothetical protein